MLTKFQKNLTGIHFACWFDMEWPLCNHMETDYPGQLMYMYQELDSSTSRYGMIWVCKLQVDWYTYAGTVAYFNSAYYIIIAKYAMYIMHY